jgi:hypothetical protein
VQDRQRALLGRTREAVTQEPLHEAYELLVCEDLLQELIEPGGLRRHVELDGRQLGYQVPWRVLPERAGPKV